MTVLAFKMSRYANAVSCLHGRVTRKAWQVLWPHHREDEVPVGHITNGVHARTWLAPAMQDLYSRRIGPDLGRQPDRSRHVGAHRKYS
jgi:starch phosphorylase